MSSDQLVYPLADRSQSPCLPLPAHNCTIPANASQPSVNLDVRPESLSMMAAQILAATYEHVALSVAAAAVALQEAWAAAWV